VDDAWVIYLTNDVDTWLDDLEVADPNSYVQVNNAISYLAQTVRCLDGPWWTAWPGQ
jgi:hypothetical protein